MVRFRKSQLYTVWLVLIIILLVVNWIGLRDRYVTSTYHTDNATQIALGDLDVSKPGLELVYLTPSRVIIVGGLTAFPWQETVFQNPDWETNPLIAISVGDYYDEYKGDEIAVLTRDGILHLNFRGAAIWHSEEIGNLPDGYPMWTTNHMFAGQFITTSEAMEIAIIGQHYNASTTTSTGRIYVASRFNSTTWNIDQVHTELTILLTGAAGDVDTSNTGDELIAGGIDTGAFYLRYDEGSWTINQLIEWVGVTRSVAVGDFMLQYAGNEIAIVRDHDIRVFYRQLGEWITTTIWSEEHLQIGIESVFIGDIDPFSPGHEVLGVSTVNENTKPVLVVLKHILSWEPNILWHLVESPTSVIAKNFDFNRLGTEILISNPPQTTVLSVPTNSDRVLRAGVAVLIPAILLLPATFLLFALAEYFGKVTDERRRARALEMIAQGYVRCPVCRRFVPKDKAEAHKRWHRTQQLY